MVDSAFEVLSPVDMQLWQWDTPETPMNMGNVCLFEGGPLFNETGEFRLDEIRRAIDTRLHLVRRYRRKVVEVPLGRPILIDDPYFDVAHHVELITLPKPGTEEQLKAAFAQVHEGVLDRSRPLWKIVFVQGLDDGRVGMIQKIHHAPFDGATTVKILESLLDTEPVPQPTLPSPPWQPQNAPSALAVLSRTAREQLTAAWKIGTGPHGLSLNPARAWRSAKTVATLADFIPAPRTSLNLPVGPRRRFDWIPTTLADVKRIRGLAPGATLNDVMLAVVAGGLRDLFLARGEDVTSFRPRVFVPVDVRAAAEAENQPGNHFSAYVPTMPIEKPDVVARLHDLRDQMASLKKGRQAGAVQLVMDTAGLVPPILQAVAGWQGHNRGLFMNLTVTNVPGPRRELYLLGAKMLELHPMLPIGTQLTLNIAVESYADKLSIGLCADPDAVPDLDVFTRGAADALADLLARAAAAAENP